MASNEAVEILRRFRTEWEYYAPRALKIKIKDKKGENGEIINGIAPFIPNTAQRYLHEHAERQLRETGKVRLLTVKGRQQGVSTWGTGRHYWKVSGEFGKRAFILAHKAEATTNLFKMTKRFHDNCPDALRPSTSGNNANVLTFDKLDSEFSVATAGSDATGRSATAQYFLGSEVAFWPNAEDHMAGIGQIVPNAPGTEIILESTGNGIGNLFHNMWEDAERGKGEYIAVFVPWFWQAEYSIVAPEDWQPAPEDAEYGEAYGLDPTQLYWRHLKITDDFRGDVGLFDQEYPATSARAFRRSTGNMLIKPLLVARARKALNVEATGARIMGVDPAEYGDDDTSMTLRQGRVQQHKVRYAGKRETMEIAGLAARRADEWQPDMINVDATGVGSGVASRLSELGYPVNRVHFGERAIESDLYVLRVDEMWGEMMKWFEDQPNKVVDCDVLERDLTSRTYTYDSSRRLKVESKERMKKRGLKSADDGDSLALTFAVPVSATMTQSRIVRPKAVNWRVV